MQGKNSLLKIIKRGGAYYNISGSSVLEVLRDAVEQIKTPESLDKGKLLKSLYERELLMTTAISKGIAIPHPRTPLIQDENEQALFICYLDKEVDFKSIDDSLVSVLFIILTSNPQTHLKVLSELTWLIQQSDFRKELANKPNTEELIEVIKKLGIK